jgi:hypothetical protein
VRTPVIVGAIAVVAFIGGVAYFKRDAREQSSATAGGGAASAPPKTAPIGPPDAPASSGARGDSASPSGATAPRGADGDAVSTPSDPRLAALKVSPDNGLIEFVKAPDGTVIAEIDKDASSPSFQKPLREYVYSQGKVVGLTAYRYVGDRVEITRTAVSYKPDGAVDELRESTSYDSEQKTSRNAR